MKKIINTDRAPHAVGPYSQAVEAAGLVFISGQLPLNPVDGKVAETIEDQTIQCLENIKAILNASGCSINDVIKTTVLLSDMDDFGAMNSIYAKYFTKDMPARISYQVSKLPMGVKVEIDSIARKCDVPECGK